MNQGILEKTNQPSAQEVLVPSFVSGESRQVEAKVFDMAEYRKRRVGREVIKITADELDYNDTLAYLYRRIEDCSVDYAPDYESEIAERLTASNSHFENHVYFEPVGNDFVSLLDKVSLIEMTSKNLPCLKEVSFRDSASKAEYDRAKLESQEISAISEWFKQAGDGDFLVYESMPLVEGEDYAVVRAYQRVGGILEGCYFSLGSSSLDQFNQVRKRFGLKDKDHETVLGLLGSPYVISKPEFKTTGGLIDYYVGTYDELLAKRNQKSYSFGYESLDGSKNQNSLEMVKSQKGLLSVFTKTVEMLAESGGRVTADIFQVCKDFEISGLCEGQKITSNKAREILEAVSLGVVHSFATVDKEILAQLEDPDVGYGASYDAAVYSSNQASANGDTYDTLCPTLSLSSSQQTGQTAAGQESSVISRAYGLHDTLEDFGKPKIGVCRIPGCPTHGESKYIRSRTLVGGCDICVACHKLFKKGKSPVRIYADQKRERNAKIEAEKKVSERESEDKRTRQEEQRRLWNAKKQKMKKIAEQKRMPDKPRFDIWAKKAA